jgi:hypothetical protein
MRNGGMSSGGGFQYPPSNHLALRGVIGPLRSMMNEAENSSYDALPKSVTL